MTTEYNGTETKEEQVSYPYSVAVRFRDAAKPYSFGAFDDSVKKGSYVVVETAQGLELGKAEADAMSVEKYGLTMPQKPVIRIAGEADLRAYEDNGRYESDAYRVCAEEIESLGLNMNLLSAKYTLDRSKVLFVYLAEQRVDFRELLKHLGARLHCRIELRQIGERDKAKMVGGIGVCGMECCCRRFKNRFDVISINMAKNQLLALNTEKLSGMCGKLMCCLKYEDDDYKQMTEGLPKMGSQVEYEGNIYRITSMNVMNEEAKLENHEQVIFITLKDLREKAQPRKGVVMQRRSDSGEPKTVINRTQRKENPDQPVHVSMELPTVKVKENPQPRRPEKREAKKERRDDRRQQAKKAPVQKNARRPQNRRPEQPSSEVKNVTVRTFGKKKKEQEESK
ncbi:MAG TPA: hypothetical protein DHW39_01730 [Erysipelotrichaceae bacterium]|nr:hypothetical protein [Erysipelotrichaceae bacterium]